MFKSYLKENLLLKLPSGSKFHKLMTALDSNIVFFSQTDFEFFELANNISKSVPLIYGNNSLDTRQTFAVLDRESDLTLLTDLVTILGKKHVIHNRGQTFLQTPTLWTEQRNYLHPLFFNTMMQIEESGLYQKWSELQIR